MTTCLSPLTCGPPPLSGPWWSVVSQQGQTGELGRLCREVHSPHQCKGSKERVALSADLHCCRKWQQRRRRLGSVTRREECDQKGSGCLWELREPISCVARDAQGRCWTETDGGCLICPVWGRWWDGGTTSGQKIPALDGSRPSFHLTGNKGEKVKGRFSRSTASCRTCPATLFTQMSFGLLLCLDPTLRAHLEKDVSCFQKGFGQSQILHESNYYHLF